MQRWIVLIVAVAVAAIAFLLWPRGVNVIVVNAGSSPMTSVSVAVTGGTFAMPNIPPNEARNVRVKPTGDSNIVLTYTDAAGPHTVVVDCYLGNGGYSGSITIDVANGTIVQKLDSIRIGIF